MSNITEKSNNIVQKEDKVSGSMIYRNCTPEQIKEITKIAKQKAKEKGLLIQIIKK